VLVVLAGAGELMAVFHCLVAVKELAVKEMLVVLVVVVLLEALVAGVVQELLESME
jgi:hypothetical protein